MHDIAKNAKSVNPQIMVIPEIYPGIEEEAVRVGADVYQMYGVVDAIAHEYEFGDGDHMASSRSQLDWFKYMVGWSSFRAFAGFYFAGLYHLRGFGIAVGAHAGYDLLVGLIVQ